MKFLTIYVFYVGVLALLELARRIISEIFEGLSQGFASKRNIKKKFLPVGSK